MRRITRDRRSVQSRLQRALLHAAEERATARLIAHIEIRESILPIAAARFERAANAMGLV